MIELAAGTQIVGRYRVERLIGSGGMGAVYEVEHLHTGQRLALKVLTMQQQGAAVERFKREARAASRIQSDHVVRVTDADVAPELGGSPFLVMELLQGADLEHATAGGAAAHEDVVNWLRQVARALAKAHEAGIVHRDLKPENLFLTQREDGTPLVKVLDFGIAKLTAESGVLTRSDQFLGTPAYMAPEQAESQGAPVTAAADLYSMGLIAFRLLVGRSYWRPGSLAQMLAQILVEPMAPASERGSTLGPEFDAWFARACARDPSKRFESAFDEVEALAGALGLPAERRSTTPASSPRRSGPMSTLESAPTVTPESGQPVPTLGASSREMTTAKTRRSRGRWPFVVAGGVVVAVGAAAFYAPGGAVKTPQPTATAVAIPVSAPTATATEVSVGAASTATTTPTTTPTATPSATPTPKPTATPTPIPAPRPSASAPPPRHRADAGRDPLDGQY
ncbi:MAG TPA: protein kinase [Polyangiaceae bacterium]